VTQAPIVEDINDRDRSYVNKAHKERAYCLPITVESDNGGCRDLQQKIRNAIRRIQLTAEATTT